MTDADEVARIKEVYDTYATDGCSAQRWDPAQPGNRAILAERQRLIAEAIGAVTGPATRSLRVVDLGSGDGTALTALRSLLPPGAAATGIDLLETRLATSREHHPDLAVVAANGAALPLPDASVDLVTVFTVFSSILDAGLARAVAAEIDRVVTPHGHLLWYDLRRDNPRNPSVQGLRLPAVQALFPGWRLDLRTCTVLPPLARRAVPRLPHSYGVLARVPLLRTHLLGLASRR